METITREIRAGTTQNTVSGAAGSRLASELRRRILQDKQQKRKPADSKKGSAELSKGGQATSPPTWGHLALAGVVAVVLLAVLIKLVDVGTGMCTSDDCIAFALRQLQEDTGVSDADLGAGFAWGEDVIIDKQAQQIQEALAQLQHSEGAIPEGGLIWGDGVVGG